LGSRATIPSVDAAIKIAQSLKVPVEEEMPVSVQENPLCLTMAHIDEWAKASEIQALVGALTGTGLPMEITIKDIREQRLIDKLG
jgi:hypothetical protein